jgi:hypothetical protein
VNLPAAMGTAVAEFGQSRRLILICGEASRSSWGRAIAERMGGAAGTIIGGRVKRQYLAGRVLKKSFEGFFR